MSRYIFIGLHLAAAIASARDNTAWAADRQTPPALTFTDALAWLPADTETVATAQDFALPPFKRDKHLNPQTGESFEIKDLRGFVVRGLHRMAIGPLVSLDDRGPYSHLFARKARFVLVGGRKYDIVSALGSLTYQGCHVIALREDLPDSGRAFVASLRASAREVRTVAGREVFVFATSFKDRDSHAKIPADEGTFILLVRPDTVWSATSWSYLQEMLARFDNRAPRQALPLSLPEWKHVEQSAPWWMMRHIGKNAPHKLASIATQQAVGSTMVYRAEPPTLEVVYLPQRESAEEYARQMWMPTVKHNTSRVTIGSTMDYTTVRISLERPDKEPLQWSFLTAFAAPGDPYLKFR